MDTRISQSYNALDSSPVVDSEVEVLVGLALAQVQLSGKA